MIEAVLVVLTRAVPGREADMDDWYSHIHIRDALRFRGSIAAQRFRRAAIQPAPPPGFDWQYLALYDVFDPERFSREHWDNALTSRMQVSDAIDDETLYDYHYYPLHFRDNDPAVPHGGGLILEQMHVAPGREGAFRARYEDDYLPAALRRPGVKSGALLQFRTFGQMIPTRPAHEFVAIYRLNDEAAAAGWRDAPARLAASGVVDSADMQVTAWERVTGRLTKDHVQHPTAAGLAAEEQARARMGDRVKTGGAEKLGLA